MKKKLLLVDYENKSRLDLSTLDKSYSAIVFVGHQQHEPKARKRIDSNNRFVKINYQKVVGYGKNALDFHIAFQLGRYTEIEPDTCFFILSADKGFDPLILNLKALGYDCARIESIEQLPGRISDIRYGLNASNPELTICPWCKKTKTIEHNGGRWCSNCGRFASPPDPEITSKLVERPYKSEHRGSSIRCSVCSGVMSSGDGIFDSDDGEWTCFGCLTNHAWNNE